MADELPTRPDEDKLEHDPVLADNDEDQAGPGILPTMPSATAASGLASVTMTSSGGFNLADGSASA